MGKKEDMIRKQKAFYEKKEKNLVTGIWYYFRNRTLNTFRKNIGLEKEIYDLHLQWLGDLSNKKVLDLGCYEGNSLSYYMAQNAKQYTALDLSEHAILKLRRRLEKIDGAKAISGDFLSSDFSETGFDLIYAYGVLHHFENTEELINKLKQKLKPEGEVISYDPLATSLPVRFVRKIYRPFQSDKEWEWPFSKNVYNKYSRSFKMLDRRAVLGKTKWLFLINFLPISKSRKDSICQSWHKKDWNLSRKDDKYMFTCMHLTMRMQLKSN